MPTLAYDDLCAIVRHLPKDLLRLMKEHQVWLAGGYIRARITHEPVSDIDLFSVSKDKCELLARQLAEERKTKIYHTRNAFTVLAANYTPVQFIHRWTFDNPVELINSFDFTIARAAIWFDAETTSWCSVCDPNFYPDLAAKRLSYCAPARVEEVGGSLLRVLKFARKGYFISPEQLAGTIARMLSHVCVGTPFWQGGEQHQQRVLAGLMRQVDPLTVIDGLRPSDDSFDAPVTAELEISTVSGVGKGGEVPLV